MTRADDYLKYVAAVVRQRIEWTTDEIGGSMCDGEHEIPLDALMDLRSEVDEMAGEFGDLNTYSDDRKVNTCTWIEEGLSTGHIWHPDPTTEKSQSWRGSLPSGDPDVPSPGIYEVTTYPETQDIHVRVVRAS